MSSSYRIIPSTSQADTLRFLDGIGENPHYYGVEFRPGRRFRVFYSEELFTMVDKHGTKNMQASSMSFYLFCDSIHNQGGQVLVFQQRSDLGEWLNEITQAEYVFWGVADHFKPYMSLRPSSRAYLRELLSNVADDPLMLEVSCNSFFFKDSLTRGYYPVKLTTRQQYQKFVSLLEVEEDLGNLVTLVISPYTLKWLGCEVVSTEEFNNTEAVGFTVKGEGGTTMILLKRNLGWEYGYYEIAQPALKKFPRIPTCTLAGIELLFKILHRGLLVNGIPTYKPYPINSLFKSHE